MPAEAFVTNDVRLKQVKFRMFHDEIWASFMLGVDWQIHTVIPVGFDNPTGADEGCLKFEIECYSFRGAVMHGTLTQYTVRRFFREKGKL